MYFFEGSMIALAILVAAFLRGLGGFGFALAAVPLLSLFLDPARAVVIAVLLQVMVGFIDLYQQRGRYDIRELGRLSLGALVGIPLGALALTVLPQAYALVAISLMTLVGLTLIWRAPAGVTHAPRTVHTLTTGLISGVFTGLAAMPGPPVVVYFLGRDIPKAVSRGSMLIFFMIAAVMAVPSLAIAGQIDMTTIWISLLCFPAMLLGTWGGELVFKRFGNAEFRIVVLVIMFAAAVLAGLRGILGIL